MYTSRDISILKSIVQHMTHSYYQIVRKKYYNLLAKINRLIQNGGLYLLKRHRKYQLLRRLERLKLRLERFGPLTGRIAIMSSLSIVLGGPLYAQPQGIHFFRNDQEINPFGIPLNISESAPIFVDIDRDGDFDLFSGSYSGTTFFSENIGSSTAPSFASIETNPFGIDISEYSSALSFADIDGDGDLDLFSGTNEGIILFQQNNGTATQASFIAPISQPFSLGIETESFASGMSIIEQYLIDGYCAPTFGDIDLDGDLDAFIGDEDADVHFFENVGNSTAPAFAYNGNPNFNLIGDSNFNGLDTLIAEATPQMCDIDGDGDLDMFIGGSNGFTFLGYNVSNGCCSSSMNSLLFVDYDFFQLGDVGSFAHPSLVDIDGDGDLDMFIGNNLGLLNFFPGRIGNPAGYGGGYGGIGILIDQESTSPFGLSRSGSGTSKMVDIDGDGDLDMFFVGGSGGDQVMFSENEGTRFEANFGSPNSSQHVLGYKTDSGFANYGGETGHIAFADIDGDGDLDAFVQRSFFNETILIKNEGTPISPSFDMTGASSNPYDLFLLTNVDFNFVDLDQDGDLDIMFRDGSNVYYAINYGSSTYASFGSYYSLFVADNNIAGAPQFVDLDYDGDLDMIFGTFDEDDLDFIAYSFSPSASATAGTGFTSSNFISMEDLGSLLSFSDITNPVHVNFVDIDSDGDLDIFATDNGSSIYFLENTNCSLFLYANHFLPHRSIYTSYLNTASTGKIPPGRDIILESGGEVSILPGFEVKEDQIGTPENPTFTAQIGGCLEDFAAFIPTGAKPQESSLRNLKSLKVEQTRKLFDGSRKAKITTSNIIPTRARRIDDQTKNRIQKE